MKLTTYKKWEKFKKGLQSVLDTVKEGFKFIATGYPRAISGLGVNITEVYHNGKCFLKGFFNAVEAWRDGHDPEGWK